MCFTWLQVQLLDPRLSDNSYWAKVCSSKSSCTFFKYALLLGACMTAMWMLSANATCFVICGCLMRGGSLEQRTGGVLRHKRFLVKFEESKYLKRLTIGCYFSPPLIALWKMFQNVSWIDLINFTVGIMCRNFRHEKTKKKRGSYKGGVIDHQSHSIKFANSDDEWVLLMFAL